MIIRQAEIISFTFLQPMPGCESKPLAKTPHDYSSKKWRTTAKN
jgi:hypothetical protein